MSFLDMSDSIMPIEPTAEERVIANMTDQQIADMALAIVSQRIDKYSYSNLSFIEAHGKDFIRNYAEAVVVFNGYREKAQEKVEAFEKMVTSVSKHVEPSMSVDTSIKPIDKPMYDDYHSIDRGPVR